MRERIKQWLAIGNRANWCVFSLFALLIFGKTLLFDYFAFLTGFFFSTTAVVITAADPACVHTLFCRFGAAKGPLGNLNHRG